MPRTKEETNQLIIEVAKKEFLAKGFAGASMREIGKMVGMTQAGLYRHFESKEGIFNYIVEPFIKRADELSKMYKNSDAASLLIPSNTVKIVKELMQEFPNELKLIVSFSGGTKYESYVHNIINNKTIEAYKSLYSIRKKNKNIREISKDEIHVLVSAYFQAVIEPIEHSWPLEKAESCLNLVEEFFIPAWQRLMGLEKGAYDEKES